MRNLLKLFGGTLFIAFSLSCSEGKKASDEGQSSGLPENPPVDVVQEESMYMRLYDEGKFPFYSSILGSFTSKCEIAAGNQGKSIECVIDVPELDIFFNDITIQYNIPSSMCEYSTFMPPWHYNWPVGSGPSLVEIAITKNADGIETGRTCTYDGVLATACNGLEAYHSEDKNTCKYDHTFSDGPNCCFGTYVEQVTTTMSAVVTTTSTLKEWGGDLKACLGGPVATSWDKFSRSGYPAFEMNYINNEGLNKIYQMKSMISTTGGYASVQMANYFKPYSATATTNHRHTGYVQTSVTSDLPYMVNPIDDLNGSSISKGNPYFILDCRDRNDEVVNRIRMYIREWNTKTEFTKYGTTSGAQGDPDLTGVEGTDCDYFGSEEYCNDMSDMDNFIGPYTLSNRSNYFPRLFYK